MLQVSVYYGDKLVRFEELPKFFVKNKNIDRIANDVVKRNKPAKPAISSIRKTG